MTDQSERLRKLSIKPPTLHNVLILWENGYSINLVITKQLEHPFADPQYRTIAGECHWHQWQSYMCPYHPAITISVNTIIMVIGLTTGDPFVFES